MIRRIAVLGAGTMGARIAAHCANAGFPVLLLDLLPADGDNRNRLVLHALEALKKSKPPAFADPGYTARIRAGNFEDDLAELKDCDWVIEAVAENLDIKRALLKKIAPHLRSDSIVTTNTSGLPVREIARDMPADFRRRWFGTHFFNPPRYMRLLEIVATPECDPNAVATVAHFGDLYLGKQVVPAHDTPNFIANRIGTFAMLNTLRVMQEMNLTVEEIDALTGTAIGWPKTGTLRLADLVGIDVLLHVIENFAVHVSDERADVKPPDFLKQMVERNWLGDKTGQGFYKKGRDSDGKDVRLVLDLKTLEHRPSQPANFVELEMAKSGESAGDRIRTLLSGNPEHDKVALFYWTILPELWSYAVNRIGEVADTLVDIDHAMRAGFNWELGPFEMWDAVGIAAMVDRMRSRGVPIPPAVEKLIAAGGASWYRNRGQEFFDPTAIAWKSLDRPAASASVATFQRSHGVVERNPGASLVDLGEGIACIEFHSKMNAIGEDIVNLTSRVLRDDGEAVRNFEAFVIASDAQNFSVGANLMQVLLAIQDEEWNELDGYVREFQAMTQAIKFCARPVVVAPFGMCLGGGTEAAMHGAARQAHVELYMGLVEASVGVVPAGGGCKETTLRVIEAAKAVKGDTRADSVELNESLRYAFETVAMAKVSASAAEARTFRYLGSGDGITMNRSRLVGDAKRKARLLADAGHVPPIAKSDIQAPGAAALANLKLGIAMMREAEYISDHDVKVGNKVANILCGGAVSAGTPVSEQYLLDLEREAFLSLCGEKKTAERIAFTLKTGKPLRN